MVGAGPGDPGLLTLRGAEVLASADAIVYDNLANPSLLEKAAPGAELVYVGKQAGRQTMKQEEINRLLVQLAQDGKKVCRLKGGDPFVFGRGGEEALALAANNVVFAVVPGVSAASAVPAYAGIPITHRGLTSSMGAITGHEDPTKEGSDLDWSKIATGMGTLVFFMGVKNLAGITQELMRHGRSADTPAALIRQGTLPTQLTITGTLADIGKKAEESGFKPPALLVVGEVVKLRQQLSWFEQRPLFGHKVVVTRARAQASELSDKLSERGAQVIELPAICIEPPRDRAPLEQAARELSAYDWIIFTSVNGVDSLFGVLEGLDKDARSFGAAKICAIGPATATRLAEKGIKADLVPERFVAEAILDALLTTEDVKGKRFLLPRADLARPALREGLEKAGANVTEVVSYHTVPETPTEKELNDIGEADLVTFASSSTVRNFIDTLGPELVAALREKCRFISIGPVTSQTMRELDIPVAIEAETSTIPGMVEAIAKLIQEKT